LNATLGDARRRNAVCRALAVEPTNKSALAENAEIVEARFCERLKSSKSPLARILRINKLCSIHAAEGETFQALKILDSISKPFGRSPPLRNSIAANDSVTFPIWKSYWKKTRKMFRFIALRNLCESRIAEGF